MNQEQLRKIMDDLKLDKHYIAMIAGVSRRTVENWLQGRKMSYQSSMMIRRWLINHDKLNY